MKLSRYDEHMFSVQIRGHVGLKRDFREAWSEFSNRPEIVALAPSNDSFSLRCLILERARDRMTRIGSQK